MNRTVYEGGRREVKEVKEVEEVKERKLLVGGMAGEVPLTGEIGVDTVESREVVCWLA
jgi:hypothetical protein